MQLRERSGDIEVEVEVVILVKSFLIGLTDVLTKGSTMNLENDISRRAATGGGVEAGAGAGALVPQVRDLQKLTGVKEERTIEVEKVVAVAVLIGIGIGVGVESEVEATARDTSVP